MSQARAWKLAAIVAELNFPADQLCTVLDLTVYAGDRFECIVAAAAGTRFPVPHISAAEAAVDPAWSNQDWSG